MKNFKKLFLILFVFSVISIGILSAEDIKDNEYYKQALDVFNNAKQAYDSGDYDKGFDLSEQARSLLQKANEYYMLQIYVIRIEAAKKEVQSKIDTAKAQGAEKKENILAELNKAIELFKNGDAKYSEGNAKTEYKDKSETYQASLDLFSQADAMAQKTLLDLWPDTDMAKAKDLLDQANNERNNLISDKTIAGSDDNDKTISGYLDSSKNFFDSNDYKASINSSQTAIAFMDKLKNTNINTDKDQAANLLAQAADKLNATKQNADLTAKYADKLKDAGDNLDSAKNLFDNNNFKDSMEKSKYVLDLLNSLVITASANDQVFPKYYVVQLVRNKRDCFWRIATKDFVYGNGFDWRILYNANKKLLRFPNNPDLIYPKVTIEIPSLKGETRDGVYDANKKYPKFDRNKDYSKK